MQLFHYFSIFLVVFTVFVGADEASVDNDQLLVATAAENGTVVEEGSGQSTTSNITIEIQDDENDYINSTTGLPTTSTSPGFPRAPSFRVGSFFIGVAVAIVIVILAAFIVKIVISRRKANSNTTPYTTYQ